MSEEDGTYWSSTIGNTFLSELERRPIAIDSWDDFKNKLLPFAIEDEWNEILEEVDQWDAKAVDEIGEALADAAATIWFD